MLLCYLTRSLIETGGAGLVEQIIKIQYFLLFSLVGFIFSSCIIFPLEILAAWGLWWIGEFFFRRKEA